MEIVPTSEPGIGFIVEKTEKGGGENEDKEREKMETIFFEIF